MTLLDSDTYQIASLSCRGWEGHGRRLQLKCERQEEGRELA